MTNKKSQKQIEKPPVVTFMGHVDHGKTSIIDAIRKTQVQLGEPGGITQHVRAHQIVHNKKRITIIDTPGHEAFTEMRSRGGQVADIGILVVAADDSVQPQTKEAIEHIQKSKAAMIVAINKIDLPSADVGKVRQDLANSGVMLEGWGGDVPVIEVSAKTGKNIEQLLEMILLVAEMQELKADPDGGIEGITLESTLDSKVGAVSTALIKKGTLLVGDYVAGEGVVGRVRAMVDGAGNNVEFAGPSDAVSILGIKEVLSVGSLIYSGKTEKEALKLSIVEEEKKEIEEQVTGGELSLSDLFLGAQEKTAKKELPIVLKTDVSGTLEAIVEELNKLSDEEVTVNIISSGTGEITEKDVMAAKGSRGIVIGFHVMASDSVMKVAAREKVLIRTYKIIYNLIDEIDDVLTSLLAPVEEEIEIAELEVKQKFILSDGTIVAGCVVRDGACKKGHKCYIMRGDERMIDSRISSLRILKEEAQEAKKGQECGVILDPQFEVEEGDSLICYRIEK